jgi:hypothetical protein
MSTRRAFLAASISAAVPDVSLACTCGLVTPSGRPATAADYFNKSTATLLAQVVDSRILVRQADGTERQQATLLALKVWKGRHAVGETIATDSSVDDIACGFYVSLNARYLFYLTGESPYKLGQCNRITRVERAATEMLELDRLVQNNGA